MSIQAIGSSTAADMTAMALARITKASKDSNEAAQVQASTQKVGGTPPAGGPPPAGGSGGAKGGGGGGSSSSSSSSKVYDPADTNKDGVVSYQEKLLYSIQHPSTDADDKQSQTGASAASASQLKTGLSAYKESQETNSTTSGSIISAV